jgi:ATP-binding protein involved in chromosome partitioning
MAVPTRIDVHPDVLFVVWDGGHESSYPHRYLRYMCGCAVCVSEWTGERVIQESTIPEDVHPLQVHPVGNYAVQVFWSDNHNTGIYSFARLREICPCPECKAKE